VISEKHADCNKLLILLLLIS